MLLAKYAEGLSVAEIAAQSGRSAKAVEKCTGSGPFRAAPGIRRIVRIEIAISIAISFANRPVEAIFVDRGLHRRVLSSRLGSEVEGRAHLTRRVKLWNVSWPEASLTSTTIAASSSSKLAGTFQETFPCGEMVIPAGPSVNE
jgi:hypothetical protein